MFNLFRRSKTIDDVFDRNEGLLAKAGGFIGNLKLTDEEVMEANNKTVSDVQQFVKDTLSESTQRSQTRRDIAKLWIRSNLALVFMAAIAGPFDKELAVFYFDMATSTIMLSTTTAITIFFYGSYGLARFQEKQKGKNDV